MRVQLWRVFCKAVALAKEELKFVLEKIADPKQGYQTLSVAEKQNHRSIFMSLAAASGLNVLLCAIEFLRTIPGSCGSAECSP